jgi:hypothetical protein
MRTGIDGVDHADELDTSKLGRAITSLAALALLANKRGDPVGLLICGGKNVAHSYIPPTRSLATILFTLASVQSAGVANLQHNIEQLSHRMRSKSIVCVASDWMEEPHTWGPNLEILASMGHDIRVLQFFSEKEWNQENSCLWIRKIPKKIFALWWQNIDEKSKNGVQNPKHCGLRRHWNSPC